MTSRSKSYRVTLEKNLLQKTQAQLSVIAKGEVRVMGSEREYIAKNMFWPMRAHLKFKPTVIVDLNSVLVLEHYPLLLEVGDRRAEHRGRHARGADAGKRRCQLEAQHARVVLLPRLDERARQIVDGPCARIMQVVDYRAST